MGLPPSAPMWDIEDTDKMLEYLPGTGAKYIVCPGLHVSSREEAYEKAELLNQLGKKGQGRRPSLWIPQPQQRL